MKIILWFYCALFGWIIWEALALHRAVSAPPRLRGETSLRRLRLFAGNVLARIVFAWLHLREWFGFARSRVRAFWFRHTKIIVCSWCGHTRHTARFSFLPWSPVTNCICPTCAADLKGWGLPRRSEVSEGIIFSSVGSSPDSSSPVPHRPQGAAGARYPAGAAEIFACGDSLDVNPKPEGPACRGAAVEDPACDALSREGAK